MSEGNSNKEEQRPYAERTDARARRADDKYLKDILNRGERLEAVCCLYAPSQPCFIPFGNQNLGTGSVRQYLCYGRSLTHSEREVLILRPHDEGMSMFSVTYRLPADLVQTSKRSCETISEARMK